MALSIAQYQFKEFPNDDWQSSTPAQLMPAMVFIRTSLASNFAKIRAVIKKEEKVCREFLPRGAALDHVYGTWQREALRCTRECFEKILEIAKHNCALLSTPPEYWAYAQTHALVADKFKKGRLLKTWIKHYCDPVSSEELIQASLDDEILARVPPPGILDSDEDYFEEALRTREDWCAPAWLSAWSFRYLGYGPRERDLLSDDTTVKRLESDETQKLLDNIAKQFWGVIETGLKSLAEYSSISVAAEGFVKPGVSDATAVPATVVQTKGITNIPIGTTISSDQIIFKRLSDGSVVAERGFSDVSLLNTYESLLPIMVQIRTLVMTTDKPKVSGAQLKKTFGSTPLGKITPVKEWDGFIQDFSDATNRATAKSATIAFLTRRTAQAFTTIEGKLCRARNPKKALKT